MYFHSIYELDNKVIIIKKTGPTTQTMVVVLTQVSSAACGRVVRSPSLPSESRLLVSFILSRLARIRSWKVCPLKQHSLFVELVIQLYKSFTIMCSYAQSATSLVPGTVKIKLMFSHKLVYHMASVIICSLHFTFRLIEIINVQFVVCMDTYITACRISPYSMGCEPVEYRDCQTIWTDSVTN